MSGGQILELPQSRLDNGSRQHATQVARELSRADSSAARAEAGQETVRDAATMLVAHEQLGFYPCEQLLAGVLLCLQNCMLLNFRIRNIWCVSDLAWNSA